MRGNVLIVLGFLAEWFLFTFSMQQAVIEFSEQQEIVNKIELTSNQYPEVPIYYWIFPPMKIWLEKNRIEKILEDLTADVATTKELYSLSNRAIAWTYIAIAEIFISVTATDEVLELFNIELTNRAFIGLNLLFIGLGILTVIFRTSDFMRSRFINRYQK